MENTELDPVKVKRGVKKTNMVKEFCAHFTSLTEIDKYYYTVRSLTIAGRSGYGVELKDPYVTDRVIGVFNKEGGKARAERITPHIMFVWFEKTE